MTDPLRSMAEPAPWVLVAGGFHQEGGMDKANAALARYLCAQGARVHLIGYKIDEELAETPGVTVARSHKPAGSFLLGHRRLARLGRAVARRVTTRAPDARVVVNGGNCDWADINWVHSFHSVWKPCDQGAPFWFKGKNRIEKLLAKNHESKALRKANLVLTNSQRTRRDLIKFLALSPERVCTVYLGTDSEWITITPDRRANARAWLGRPAGRPLVAFVGALGYDNNKGFDTLLAAWQLLCADPGWDADLVVAGGGRALGSWRRAIERARLNERVKMLGFTHRITDVLAASDLLVSPVRYESYGLNVQEAISCGVPAMVSAKAGVAERYPADLRDLLLPNPEDVNDLVERMMRWRSDIEGAKRRIEPMARMLRGHSWQDMAREIVACTERAEAQT